MTYVDGIGTPFKCHGTLCTWDNQPGVVDPTWKWINVGDKFWVGTNPDNKCVPADLKRPRIWPGTDVKLKDGLVWHIPHYRKAEHSFQLDEEGNTIRAPKPEYRELIEKCENVIEQIFETLGIVQWLKDPDSRNQDVSEELKVVTIQDGLSLAMEIVALNYRITEQIAIALDFIDDSSLVRILVNMIEMPSIIDEHEMQRLKKNTRGFDVSVNVEQPI